MLRGCYRFPSTLSFSRVFLNERILLSRSATARLPASSATGPAAAVRTYSSDRGRGKQNQKVVVVGIPNPFIWFRTRIYYFLIRAYFDKEFNIEEFTEGAKQVCHSGQVSCMYSCQYVAPVLLLLLMRTRSPCYRPSPMSPDCCPSVSLKLWKGWWLKTWVWEPSWSKLCLLSPDVFITSHIPQISFSVSVHICVRADTFELSSKEKHRCINIYNVCTALC